MVWGKLPAIVRLFFLPLSMRRPDIEYILPQRALNPNQPINVFSACVHIPSLFIYKFLPGFSTPYIIQEGHGGPGSLTWVCEPRIFKLTDFGIKQAKVIIFTNYEGSPSSF